MLPGGFFYTTYGLFASKHNVSMPLHHLYTRVFNAKLWHIRPIHETPVVEEVGASECRSYTDVSASPSFQSGNRSEFSIGFMHTLSRYETTHRHSKVRRSNNQAHVEHFNRTVQEEHLDFVPLSAKRLQKALSEHLPYYNGERIHMGIKFKTPLEVI